jgi:SOS response regulatory protein OraA/RecX
VPGERERAPDAVELGVRALRSRDHSEASLRARLERRGVPEDEREDAVGRLRALGYVDDMRFALARAETLASRGAGDELIADDLERHGVDGHTVTAAIAAIAPEPIRAATLVEQRGPSLRTVRYLASKGFADDTIEGVVASLADDGLG